MSTNNIVYTFQEQRMEPVATYMIKVNKLQSCKQKTQYSVTVTFHRSVAHSDAPLMFTSDTNGLDLLVWMMRMDIDIAVKEIISNCKSHDAYRSNQYSSYVPYSGKY